MSIGHTYGPSCMLQPTSNAFTRRASIVSVDPPPMKAQFFYCSALPIDDPLSAVPPPSGSTGKPSKVPPSPFSVNDSIALENAWLRLQNPRKPEPTIRSARIPGSVAANGTTARKTTREEKKAAKLGEKDNAGSSTQLRETDLKTPLETNPFKKETHVSIPAEDFCEEKDYGSFPRSKPFRKIVPAGDPHLTLCDDPDHIPFDETMPVDSEEIGNDEFEGGIIRKRSRSPFRRREKLEKPKDKDDSGSCRRLSAKAQKVQDAQLASNSPDRNMTRLPFLRTPSRRQRQRRSSSRSRSYSPEHLSLTNQTDDPPATGQNAVDDAPKPSPSPKFQSFHSGRSESEDRPGTDGARIRDSSDPGLKKPEESHIPVGVSRLHVVSMPYLKMGPIYWDPIHDISSVVRGTWFYKETMWPVESELANQIEEGYEYIKPWTQAYIDELNSCLEIGPEAELKVCHKIWPADDPPSDQSRPIMAKGKKSKLNPVTEIPRTEEKERQDAVQVAHFPENKAAGGLDGFDDPVRLYAKSSIIFANNSDGQILKPSQLPSVARGRKPLKNIRKGRIVGVPVVRGFDYKEWEKLHPPTRKAVAAIKAREGIEAIRTATNVSYAWQKSCGACMTANDRQKPTDLILVIHGIGQKLSERVESFHFTHNINAFRRQINLELESDMVKPWLRQELGGIMVLPVNWRSTLKLEDGGPDPNPHHREADSNSNHYSLKDITAESLPAVRNLISDVMLDIPYYLSHHKVKMIEAVTREANRIYRLWCINNPGFYESGRVHLIAHSLGSVMALDILSKQPTKLPKPLDFKTTKVRTDIFEFDTKGLFFCGSPAGFFLLLNKAAVLPRKGRNKPDTEGEDMGAGVAGEAGTYGCLAVDNLYNVSHYLDPVAYHMNACVDVDYAASLQTASVPSTTHTWAQYFGFGRSKTIGQKNTHTDLETFSSCPPLTTLPSTVEMETHDFTKEEIAEKRMFLLNDNGQIDYTLHSGGGPLEIQYLNMLSAHSSYWTLQDFVRFLVVEVGRKPGKHETVSSIKAVKKVWGKK